MPIVRLSVPTLALALVATVLAASSRQGQAPPVFAAQCAGCHGEDGRGTAQGPALAMNQRVAEQSAEQLAGISPARQRRRGHAVVCRPRCRRPVSAGALSAASQCRHDHEAARRDDDSPAGVGPAAAGRLAHLQRFGFRQSVQPPQADHDGQCVEPQAEVGLPDSVLRPGDHAAGGGRRAVCHGTRTRCSPSRPRLAR